MHVETFELTEVKELNEEEQATCFALVQELGLVNQSRFYQAREESHAVVFPYRKLTAQENIVYKLLCPNETQLEHYAEGPIPLRVLNLVALCKDQVPGTGKWMIWYPSNADVKDPILLWREETAPYNYTYWLVARWGEVLEEFQVLTAYAKVIWIATTKPALEKIQLEIQANLSHMDSAFEEMYHSGRLKIPAFYFN